MATHFQHGLTIGSSVSLPTGLGSGGPLFAVHFDMYGTALAAASGTIIDKWRCVLPPVATRLQGVGVAFSRGGNLPVQGALLRFKVWNGGTRKGLVGGAPGGGTAEAMALLPTSGSPTFPASAHFQLSVETVGATQAGTGARPTAYFSYA